jgi:hypothetical protein
VHCVFPVQLVVVHGKHDGYGRSEAESDVVMHKGTTTFSNSLVDKKFGSMDKDTNSNKERRWRCESARTQ